MYTVTREISFSYGHRLLQYHGKCARLHGHNGRLRVTLGSKDLDQVGMVVDFFDIKRTLSHWIDEHLDHWMVLHKDDPALAALRAAGEPITTVDFNPTAENLARHVFEYLRGCGMPVVEVRLQETESCAASYAP
jgi:6-pyruvoyltetrahydropterin/6-carboxytetrahydropterin synthase